MSAARILLVEDEHDLADVIVENLTAEGYEASLARDGDSGLATALRGDRDLIILDVMLPGVDGFTICHTLRDAGVQVPVLFLTARDQSEDRIRGLEEGGDDYLTKP